MGYEFRKLYADIVTADGTVCVLYHAWARVLGRWHGRSCAEIYRPASGLEVLQAGERLPVPDEETAVAQLPLHARLVNGPFELDYEPEHGAFTPPTPPCPGLRWSVKLARGRARARGPGIGELAGTGYIDWVTMTRPPRALGLRSLAWGRAHLAEATAVYTVLDFADGRRWSAGARWPSPELLAAEARIDGRGRGTVALGPTSLELDAVRLLHGGDALGPARIPRRLDRIVARVLGGPMVEARWLARAWDAADPRGGGWAVHERVDFGDQPL